MKKTLFVITSFLVFFLGMTNIYAKTLLKQTEISNGTIGLAIKIEDGYVGAIDLNIILDGNVDVTTFHFDSSLLASYTKHYSYNKTNKTLSITLATGNMKHNLVNKDGMINLGTVTVAGVDNSGYHFKASNMTIADMKYHSIVKDDLESQEIQFILKGQSTPIEPDKPIEPEEPSENPNDSKQEQPVVNPEIPDTNHNNNSDNNQQDNEIESPTEPENKEENVKPNEKENQSKENETDKKVESKENSHIIVYILSGLGIVIIGMGIYFYRKRS